MIIKKIFNVQEQPGHWTLKRLLHNIEDYPSTSTRALAKGINSNKLLPTKPPLVSPVPDNRFKTSSKEIETLIISLPFNTLETIYVSSDLLHIIPHWSVETDTSSVSGVIWICFIHLTAFTLPWWPVKVSVTLPPPPSYKQLKKIK